MMRKSVITAVILTVTALLAPRAGAEGPETIQELYSPVFLAGGSSVVSEQTPYSDAVNPAASADNQLVTLDLNYLALTGETGVTGWGHAVNLGMSFPAKFGVISGSANLLTSTAFTEINSATQGGVHLSFAKDLFPDFHVGLGLNAFFGAGWALGMDLGIIHMPGDLGFMHDFTWGAALRNFGYSALPVTGDYPRMFILQGGARAVLLDSDPFQIEAALDAIVPGFTNFRLQAGGNIIFRDILNLSLASRMDVAEMLAGDFSGLIPSFGIGFTFSLNVQEDKDILGLEKRGWGNSNLTIDTAAAPLQNGLWAFGGGIHMPLGIMDRQAPVITIDYGQTEYISPNHDGVQDELTVPIAITDTRYIKEFNFVITDEDGETVRTIVNKEVRDEDLEFKNIMARLVYVKTGIPVPEEIRWDGYADNGNIVPDGTYTFSMNAADDNGNTGTSEAFTVVVDNTAPVIEIELTEDQGLIFSPNNDGNKDTLNLGQTGSKEDLWHGEIRSADGAVKKTYDWRDASPGNMLWDGTDDNGTLVQDGVYHYFVESTDRGGNTTEKKITNIIKNTQETPISLSIDASFFAPGIEGSRNSIVFRPQVPVTTGIETWTLKVENQAGRTVRTYTGGSELVKEITFDGKTDQGGIVPEGPFKGRLEVFYVNGNRPSSESPVFTVDKTRPGADVTVDKPAVFSPDGDGLRDTLTFYQDTSVEGTWKGTIYSETGEEVKSFVWIEKADQVLIWDGYDGLGRNVPDGEYTYTLSSVDRALNSGASKPVTFRIDTIPTPVSLQAEQDAFSPNGDGKADQMSFVPRLEVTEGIREYSFSIRSEGGEPVWTSGGRASVPASITWDGFTDQGDRAAEGTYSGELKVLYQKGDESTAASRKFLLDSVYPSLEVSCETKLFSPEGDGRKDTITLLQTSSNETLWTAEISDESGNMVRRLMWKGSLDNFVWDGTDEAGNTVKDGSYTYTVETEDRAGNAVSGKVEGIVVDTRQTTIFATADAEGFTPNGDGRQEEIGFNLIVNETRGVTRWNLDIVDSGGKTVKNFSETRIPEKVIWNGIDDDGRTVEGIYRARFSVEYAKGNLPVSETTEFILDKTPPKTDITMGPVPFSPDNDGYDDELTIHIATEDLSGVRSWKLTILDRAGHVFQEFQGERAPAESLTWDGRGRNGDTVLSAEDYPYEFEAVDEYGLKSVAKGVIPIDVLVFRDGNKLKIQIANITFAANSPLFETTSPEIVDKNDYVIGRIAQILEKYSTYNITIEGHAVNLSWADPVKREKEEKEELLDLSRQRAQTVKDKLIALGIDEGRIDVVGMGGTRPLVPHGDLENRWKNRRVEFILEK